MPENFTVSPLTLADLLKETTLQIFVTADPAQQYYLSHAEALFRALYEIANGKWRDKLKYSEEDLNKMTGAEAAQAYRDYVFEVIQEEDIDLDR